MHIHLAHDGSGGGGGGGGAAILWLLLPELGQECIKEGHKTILLHWRFPGGHWALSLWNGGQWQQLEVSYHTDMSYRKEMRKRSDRKRNDPPVLHFLCADGNRFHKVNVTAAFHQVCNACGIIFKKTSGCNCCHSWPFLSNSGPLSADCRGNPWNTLKNVGKEGRAWKRCILKTYHCVVVHVFVLLTLICLHKWWCIQH